MIFKSISGLQDEDQDISYKLLKTDVEVADIKFCNSSSSYEGAMKPGMFCAGRLKKGLSKMKLIFPFLLFLK